VFTNCDAGATAFPGLLDRYINNEPIAVHFSRDELFNPAVSKIVVRAGGDYTGTVNEAKVNTSLRWKLTLVRR
jgi:hypothetical protein